MVEMTIASVPENSWDDGCENPVSVERSVVLGFEEWFDQGQTRKWVADNFHYSYWICVAYMLAIVILKSWMKNRPAYKLRMPLLLWNTFLAVFSIGCFWRLLPDMKLALSMGRHYLLCSNFTCERVTNFWSLMFTLSKIVELGDTMFLILRKRPVIFLHWYHHVTVLLNTTWMYYEALGAARIFGFVNLFIHSIMYTYYALMVLRIRLPKFIAFSITCGQIFQMFLGFGVCVYVTLNGSSCHQGKSSVAISALLMYISYMILFVDFFTKSYFGKKPQVAKKVE